MPATDERFTPPHTLALRDRVWPGGADTDPAWHPRSFSRARICYTKRDDGLQRSWFGRVWLNPPWSDVMPWLLRLLAHLELGLPGREGMMLVRNDPSTAWFKLAVRRASAVALLGERTRYWWWNPRRRSLEECGTPEFASVVFYFGPDVQRFLAVFRAEGHVALPLREHSTHGKVRTMPSKKKAAPSSARAGLDEQLRRLALAHVAEYARTHPDATLGELAAALGGSAEVLMDLRVCDLWPNPGAALAHLPKNGHANGRAAAPRKKARTAKPPKPPKAQAARREAASGQDRVEQVRGAIAALGRPEFTTSDITSALGCSRQTVLRALERMPEVKTIGKLKSAKHVVQQ